MSSWVIYCQREVPYDRPCLWVIAEAPEGDYLLLNAGKIINRCLISVYPPKILLQYIYVYFVYTRLLICSARSFELLFPWFSVPTLSAFCNLRIPLKWNAFSTGIPIPVNGCTPSILIWRGINQNIRRELPQIGSLRANTHRRMVSFRKSSQRVLWL